MRQITRLIHQIFAPEVVRIIRLYKAPPPMSAAHWRWPFTRQTQNVLVMLWAVQSNTMNRVWLLS